MNIDPSKIVISDDMLGGFTVKKTNPNGQWKFEHRMGLDNHIGFVYVIRDNFLKRFYLGKKFYWVKRRAAGPKPVESDWKTYKSSSGLIKEIFKERDLADFEFICLEEYKARGAVSYAETWSLCHVEAPTTLTWYNTRIEEVSWNVKENITDRHKERLKRVIAMDTFNE